MPYLLLAKAAVGYHPSGGHETSFRSHSWDGYRSPWGSTRCAHRVHYLSGLVKQRWTEQYRADSEFRLTSAVDRCLPVPLPMRAHPEGAGDESAVLTADCSELPGYRVRTPVQVSGPACPPVLSKRLGFKFAVPLARRDCRWLPSPRQPRNEFPEPLLGRVPVPVRAYPLCPQSAIPLWVTRAVSGTRPQVTNGRVVVVGTVAGPF